MNCKQGDLAVIVNSCCGNEGKIVRCVRLISQNGLWICPDGSIEISPVWEIDIELTGFNGEKGKDVQDAQLRPIRDPGDDATDETLTWLPVPHKEIA